jgi:hypothetical protein
MPESSTDRTTPQQIAQWLWAACTLQVPLVAPPAVSALSMTSTMIDAFTIVLSMPEIHAWLTSVALPDLVFGPQDSHLMEIRNEWMTMVALARQMARKFQV